MGFIVFMRIGEAHQLTEVANFKAKHEAIEYCHFKNIKAAVAKDKAK